IAPLTFTVEVPPSTVSIGTAADSPAATRQSNEAKARNGLRWGVAVIGISLWRNFADGKPNDLWRRNHASEPSIQGQSALWPRALTPVMGHAPWRPVRGQASGVRRQGSAVRGQATVFANDNWLADGCMVIAGYSPGCRQRATRRRL